MKRIALIGILLVAACKTAAPQKPAPAVDEVATAGAFETAEAAGARVERMHADGEATVALVVLPDGRYELLRLELVDGAWVIVDRKPASEDYLWPEQ